MDIGYLRTIKLGKIMWNKFFPVILLLGWMLFFQFAGRYLQEEFRVNMNSDIHSVEAQLLLGSLPQDDVKHILRGFHHVETNVELYVTGLTQLCIAQLCGIIIFMCASFTLNSI